MSSGVRSVLADWFETTVLELGSHFRWSFLPPLMVYFAAGISGLTAIVGAFFVKEYLGLSAAFLAGLAFWVGLPWALKMPIGHLVDIFWRWKSLFVFLGASLIAASLAIMVCLVSFPHYLTPLMGVEGWYVTSALLSPCGYVVQDAVADAMSVEAVPKLDENGEPFDEAHVKSMHTTMQMLGRVALISGLVLVALVNIFMFDGVESLSVADKAVVYGRIYLLAFVIPFVSISGVLLAQVMKERERARLQAIGMAENKIVALLDRPVEEVDPNYWYFGGGLAFVILALTLGLSDFPLAKEIIFLGSMGIVLLLMFQLIGEMDPAAARVLFGTAIIIFVFRAMPLPGPGLTWFEIDVLGFDQQFLSVLTLIVSLLTLVGMVVLRPIMAKRSIAFIVVLLTVAGVVLSLPNIGLYYGIHNWTAPMTGGVVDARFIALIDAAIESPLGQIAMIPMLAWIAKNAPAHLKATFFAVMASFTNLALSASSLLTKYLNGIFVVTREVRDRDTGAILIEADYSALGWLLIVVALISLTAPLITILIVQSSRLRTSE
ncbi:MAG: hypothetical protein AAFU56_00610 [Pseudomonadota bacterium]